jgi:hydroxymethylbilane synthase
MNLRIGSRGSQLALWQANHIAGLLRARGHSVEIEIIKTTGDSMQDATFAQVGTKGMFTKEIEEALAHGQIQLAVHSLKDLPTELPEPFALAATRRSARCIHLAQIPESCFVAAGRARGHQQPAPLRTVESHPPGH